jgi:DUF438 domain-containing protein
MKTGELLEKHPLATEVIRTWFFDQMVASFADESVPEEFKEMMKQEGVTNERLATLIDVQPRTLFDVFDENNIYIGTLLDESNGFWWTINENKSTVGYTYRKNCEIAAIENAFDLLEERLKPIELPTLEEN